MKTKQLLTLLAGAALSLTACAAKREIPYRSSPGAPFTDKLARYDYTTYQAIPDTPTSAVYRIFLKTIPYTRERAFYGNWAGNGSRGGQPVDAVDEIFRRHDIAYAEARCLRTMQWADEACVEALAKLDTRTLSQEAIEFRELSSSFFSNRALALVGKPVSAVVKRSESNDCPFQSEEDVRQLFGLNEPKVSAPERHASPPALTATTTHRRNDASAHRSELTKRPPLNHSRQLAVQDHPLPAGTNWPAELRR